MFSALQTPNTMKKHTLAALATTTLLSLSANAALTSQLGILDLTANGGINPATGAAWAHNDTYRLVFASSAGRDALSTDIADYNAFIQGLANASPLGLSSVTWNALVSSETVDARDNTSTNPTVNGTGESFWLMNGTEFIADNYADFYGSRLNGENIDRSETGGTPFDGGDFTSVWTGSRGDGTKDPAHFVGSLTDAVAFGDADDLPETRTGLWGTGSAAQWPLALET